MQRGSMSPTFSGSPIWGNQQDMTLVQTRFSRFRLATDRKTQHDDRQRTLRAAALAVVADLDQRPRGVWDEIARINRPTRRFELVQEPMRVAVKAGAGIDSVCDFYMTLMLDALAVAPTPITFDAASAALRAIREESEAVEAVAIATARPTFANTDRALKETEEAIAAGRLYVACARRARLAGRLG